jgi:ribosomal-protein-alanine N-acetyltransferase
MNPLPVRIRRMAPADLARVMEIAQSLKDAPHWPRTAYETALDPQSVPHRIVLVAEGAESGSVAGFAVASVLPPQAELETIAVAAERQRRGVGRNLFAFLAGELVTAQVQELFLEVRASNGPALALYQSLGFSEGGRRPRYYVDPVEDALLLTLRLA